MNWHELFEYDQHFSEHKWKPLGLTGEQAHVNIQELVHLLFYRNN